MGMELYGDVILTADVRGEGLRVDEFQPRMLANFDKGAHFPRFRLTASNRALCS